MMKPIDQRYYRGQHRPMGDCLQACVASIFELPLDDVPHFVEIMYQRGARHDITSPNAWDHTTSALLGGWAWAYGIGSNWNFYFVNGERVSSLEPLHYHPGYWIGVVETRDPGSAKVMPESTHAIVMLNNQVIHDPNPDSRIKPEPYRFVGERWFELARPEMFMSEVAAR